MPSFRVQTPQRSYDAIVDRGSLARIAEFVPKNAGKLFVATTADVWELHGGALRAGLQRRDFEVLLFPGGEPNKRLAEVEILAEKMVRAGGDRSSVLIAFGGGIIGDVAGFLAAIFMRGIPVIQVPTTLLAQVDAAVGGKTGVNLESGKNLLGSFHQPLAVLIDPDVLRTLPEREYRAGLYEIVKCGVIRDAELFDILDRCAASVLKQEPAVLERIIAAAVRIKAEVVTADERESGLRRILNFGHTFGHALEAETRYNRLLHGEAVAWGMRAATFLAERTGHLASAEASQIQTVIQRYGPIPPLDGIPSQNLAARLRSDKKTVQGKVHFVLPVKIGEVTVASGIDDKLVMQSIEAALA
ncbi:MAG: 3-dehydroquinate synthase [Bryobacterales bacterium]|nr:3-dehydroquinate synthase [Bryobacterales bacterium]MBV9398122.1 3-dehydroquinate synthase [Bryobacterales bacterium]